MRSLSVKISVAFLLCVVGKANGGLLTPAYEAQLESWLGQGDQTFTKVFSKINGDTQTSVDFHRAVDGKGPTFTLMKVYSYDLPLSQRVKVIGGYNPQSWDTSGNYHIVDAIADRTAFIFNLTDSVRQMERTDDSRGRLQTYNRAGYGPTFGGGHDIYVADNLVNGYAYQWSYGTPSVLGYGGISIDGKDTRNGSSPFAVDAIEVYAFSSTVPEPSVLAACSSLGVLGVVAAIRNRRRMTMQRTASN